LAIHRLQLTRQGSQIMDLVDRLAKLDQPCFEQLLHALLGVKHHRITQAWTVSGQEDLHGFPIALGLGYPLRNS
jgi:hypothetical protein